jgi:ribonuclease VapC
MVAIAADERRLISAVTLLGARMVTRGRYGDAGQAALESLLETMEAEIVPFDDAQADLAYEAFATYGKGIHPTARLNLCDCVAYALAKSRSAPLLYKGSDFRSTDIASVI